MEKYLNEFIEKLRAEGKSENTIKSYTLHMQEYFKWFADSFGNIEFKGLYRSNIQEYKNYLKNIKKELRLYEYTKEKETATIRNAMYSGQLQAGNATI